MTGERERESSMAEQSCNPFKTQTNFWRSMGRGGPKSRETAAGWLACCSAVPPVRWGAVGLKTTKMGYNLCKTEVAQFIFRKSLKTCRHIPRDALRRKKNVLRDGERGTKALRSKGSVGPGAKQGKKSCVACML